MGRSTSAMSRFGDAKRVNRPTPTDPIGTTAAPCRGLFPLPSPSGSGWDPAPRAEQSRTLGIPLGEARCSLSLGRGSGWAARTHRWRIGRFPELSNWTSPLAKLEVSPKDNETHGSADASRVMRVVGLRAVPHLPIRMQLLCVKCFLILT